MPLAATSTRAACAQIHVALNGQQYADTGTLFQFNDYCGGQVILTDPRGQIKDHPEGSGPPRPYSFCQWIITIDIADVIPEKHKADWPVAVPRPRARALPVARAAYVVRLR